ncbi:MAG: peroxiredoxin [Cyclobacteriaceae bacterium]|nr:peroxiredoxin [Cyclobacteriaceae bacterium]
MVLVGKKAPDFTAQAVINGGEIVSEFSLSDYKGKYVVLFFYPKDFTFVCPSELFAFQEALAEFESKNVQIIAVSTDTEQSHWGWLQMEKNKGGIKGITYPLVADTNKTISANYDVLQGEWDYNEEGEMISTGTLVPFRGLFLIDKEGIVKHQLVNVEPIGRNVEDTMRVVDALQFHEEHGDVCPANWSKGKEGMKETHEGVAEYLSNH